MSTKVKHLLFVWCVRMFLSVSVFRHKHTHTSIFEFDQKFHHNWTLSHSFHTTRLYSVHPFMLSMHAFSLGPCFFYGDPPFEGLKHKIFGSSTQFDQNALALQSIEPVISAARFLSECSFWFSILSKKHTYLAPSPPF